MSEKKYKYKITDRDYFYSKYQDFLNEGELNESKGSHLWDLLSDLTSELGNIQELSDSEIKEIRQQLETLKRIMKKNLKGKGLLGW